MSTFQEVHQDSFADLRRWRSIREKVRLSHLLLPDATLARGMWNYSSGPYNKELIQFLLVPAAEISHLLQTWPSVEPGRGKVMRHDLWSGFDSQVLNIIFNAIMYILVLACFMMFTREKHVRIWQSVTWEAATVHPTWTSCSVWCNPSW